jgi:2',3'-cyclic-nucleotide 2'-phosphodiesterase (5'-nucleotidase family)
MKVKSLRLRTFVLVPILFLSGNLLAAEKAITIIHTNDLHSHILGFSPNIDYRPDIKGGDATQGGWARIATALCIRRMAFSVAACR